MTWRKSRDPLFRGDNAAGPAVPDPRARIGIVPHVLYLGGAGRASPFQSTTESEDVAAHFAGSDGHVYRTSALRAEGRAVVHIGQVELKRLLRGKGHGRARWPSALEVMQARRYVEQWSEHLLDFSEISQTRVSEVVTEIYER